MALVRMRHPEIQHAGDLPVTTEEAFRDVWDAKGWQIVADDEAPAEVADDEAQPDEPVETDDTPTTSGGRRRATHGS